MEIIFCRWGGCGSYFDGSAPSTVM